MAGADSQTVSTITTIPCRTHTIPRMDRELAEIVQDILLSSGIFASLIVSYRRTEEGLEVVLESGESYEVKVVRR